MQRVRLFVIIGSLLLTAGGDALIYYNSYKHWGGRPALGMFMIFVAALMLSFIVFRKWVFVDEVSYGVDKKQWLINKSKYVASILCALGFMILNISVSSALADKRVDNILNNKETRETTATVIRLETKRGFGRGSRTTYTAHIKYSTTSGTILQSMDNTCQCHNVGEEMQIIYAVEYPDVYCLAEQ